MFDDQTNDFSNPFEELDHLLSEITPNTIREKLRTKQISVSLPPLTNVEVLPLIQSDSSQSTSPTEKPMTPTSESSPCSMQPTSLHSPTGPQTGSLTRTGKVSKDTPKVFVHLPLPNEITVQDLNSELVTKTGQLSNAERNDHRALIKTYRSLANMSIKDGCNNGAIIFRPDVHIEGLIKAGILPEGCVIGRHKFVGLGYLERTALNVPVNYLMEVEHAIKDWVEDHTSDNPDDVFDALLVGSMIAGSQGFYSFSSPLLNTMTSRLRALPDTSTKVKVLRNKDSLFKLTSAD